MSSNPHRNPLRNATKKLNQTLDLKVKQESGAELTAEQVKKLATLRQCERDVEDLKNKFAIWEAEQVAFEEPPPAPQPVKEEKPKKEKKERKESKKQIVEDEPVQEVVEKVEKPQKEKKQKQKQKEQAAPATAAPVMEIDDSANPYKKQIRNINKKLNSVAELEAEAASGKELNADQKSKIAAKKSAERELATLNDSSERWIQDQIDMWNMVLEANKNQTTLKTEVKKEPKANKDKWSDPSYEAKKKEAVKEAKEAAAPKPAAKKDNKGKNKNDNKGKNKEKAEQAPARVNYDVMDLPAEVKPYYNKVRNLRKKVDSVVEMSKKPQDSLTAEQKQKVKSLKSIQKDLADSEHLLAVKVASI